MKFRQKTRGRIKHRNSINASMQIRKLHNYRVDMMVMVMDGDAHAETNQPSGHFTSYLLVIIKRMNQFRGVNRDTTEKIVR